MKKLFVLFVSLILVAASFTWTAEAKGSEYAVILDGGTLKFSNAPYLSGHSLMVEAKVLFEADGLSWALVDHSLSAGRKGLTLKLTVGSKKATVNGKSVDLGAGVAVIKGKTFVSLDDYAKLADKELSKNTSGTKYYLKSHLKDRVYALVFGKTSKLRYEGALSNAMREGEGKLYVNNVLLYEGDFSADAMHGYGKLYLDGGMVFEGGFRDNAPHGTGTYYMSNGEQYIGDFKDGRMTGFGKLYRGAALLYDGEWLNDKMSGTGTVYGTDGNPIYAGELKGNVRNGFGILYNGENKAYQGNWANGKMQGEGMLFDSEGTLTAYGTFANNKLNGTGTKVTFGTSTWYVVGGDNPSETIDKETAYLDKGTFVDGVLVSKTDSLVYTTFEGFNADATDDGTEDGEASGSFDDNKVPNGKGLLYRFKGKKATRSGVLSSNELLYAGDIKDGVREGFGSAYEDGKLVYTGEFSDDLRWGMGRAYENGLLVYDGEWRANFRNGEGKSYKYAGDVAGYTGKSTVIITEGTYLANKLRTTGLTYRYDGTLRNGLITGTGSLYVVSSSSSISPFSQPGTLYYTGGFLDGRKQGDGKLYNGGSLVFEGKFSNDKRNGIGIEYTNNVKTFEGNFVDNRREGPGKAWQSNGLILFDGNYMNDKKDGFGKLYEWGWLVYEGDFKDDKKHGYGRLYKSGQLIYEGEFINDARADGK